ncbi:hypothetical protein SLEP1_g28657 [Rubroshorea leprosula]|uniref:ABC1 atypical kinase-like domain-containing protein n=2 Tax=Rubroshorea leprosula TaxID=152421 RepID=A0AAV5K547_9ROSI|nr:hypothetical protein SLEP1_g28657 [Rubroshorea leprosula]
MSALLALHYCCSHKGERMNLSFSSSISHPFVKFERQICTLPMADKSFRFKVKMRQTESSSRVDPDRQAVKMVPVSEVRKRKTPSTNKAEKVNGVNQVTDGVSIIRRAHTLGPIKSPNGRGRAPIEPSPIDELKVLPSDEAFSWANENYSSWQRNIDVWSFIISLRIRILLDNAKWTYFGGFTEDKRTNRRKRTASWLRERLLQLGPTFIKLGQLSSARSDIFPQEYIDELAKLQDKVPAFSAEKARRFVETELGAPIEHIFKEFDDWPIAAASLGQVHRATLHDGEKVIVKVQRPGLKKLFDIDLGNLKLIAEYFQNTETYGGPTRDWIGIYEGCRRILYEEIDYINEGRNADKLRRDFRNIKWVRVPMVYWNYTATKVLTMEYVPGIKINQLDELDSRGYDRSRISSRVIEAYLIQLLKTGFFHADPHPGNLAIDVDEALIYYDCGLMGNLQSSTRARLIELFNATYEKDVQKVIQCLIDLEVLQPKGDLSPVRRSVQFFLDNLLNQRPDQEATIAAIGEDLFAIAQDQLFRIPFTIAFILRAFSTLEGVGYMLSPDFSFAKIAAPYIQELLSIRERPRSGTQLVDELRKQADDARSYTMSMPYRVQRIEEFVKQLESGDLKLRVRVMESERAAHKATIMQKATIYAVLGGTLLNLGFTIAYQGSRVIANGSFIGAGVCLILFLRSMQMVKKLDKFEKMI